MEKEFLPFIENPERSWLHAVDAPVGDALVVADGDGEAAVVGPHQVDGGALLAGDVQDGALAAILRPLF